MGEIADDTVDGAMCSLCGCYFEHPDKPDQIYEHGYPVVCWDCWDTNLTNAQRKEYQRAQVPTL